MQHKLFEGNHKNMWKLKIWIQRDIYLHFKWNCNALRRSNRIYDSFNVQRSIIYLIREWKSLKRHSSSINTQNIPQITLYSQIVVTITINFVRAHGYRYFVLEMRKIKQRVDILGSLIFTHTFSQQEESIPRGRARLRQLRWYEYRLRAGLFWWPLWRNCKAFFAWEIRYRDSKIWTQASRCYAHPLWQTPSRLDRIELPFLEVPYKNHRKWRRVGPWRRLQFFSCSRFCRCRNEQFWRFWMYCNRMWYYRLLLHHYSTWTNFGFHDKRRQFKAITVEVMVSTNVSERLSIDFFDLNYIPFEPSI